MPAKGTRKVREYTVPAHYRKKKRKSDREETFLFG